MLRYLASSRTHRIIVMDPVLRLLLRPGPFGMVMGERHPGEFVADVFDEERDESRARICQIHWVCANRAPTISCAVAGGNKNVPKVAAFYSTREVNKQVQNRVHHNNSECPLVREIAKHDMRPGTDGYRLCDDCLSLNNQEPLLARADVANVASELGKG
jgi:hypothetical protein